jgi:hypothetical protein
LAILLLSCTFASIPAGGGETGDCVGAGMTVAGGGAGGVAGACDCNKNGIPDEVDIANGLSEDQNGDGVPDECCGDVCGGSDCNDNGVEDQWDIALGGSLDCNCNAIPDECEDPPPTSCTPPGRNDRRGHALPASDELAWLGPLLLPVCGGGSPSVDADDLVLEFGGLPPGETVVVVAGNVSLEPDVGLSVVKNQVFLTGPLEVFGVKVDAFGRAVVKTPLSSLPSGFAQPGDTVRYQCLFSANGGKVTGYTRAYLVDYTP